MGCKQVSLLGCQSGATRCRYGFLPNPWSPQQPIAGPDLSGYTGLRHSQYPWVTLDLWHPHLLLPRQLVLLLGDGYCCWVMGSHEIGWNHIYMGELLQSNLRNPFHLGKIVLCSSQNNNKNCIFQGCKKTKGSQDDQCATNSENWVAI